MRLIVWDYAHYEVHGGKEVFVDVFVREFLSRGHEVLLVTGENRSSKSCQIQFQPGLQTFTLPSKLDIGSTHLFSIIKETKSRIEAFGSPIIFSQSFGCISRILIDILLTTGTSELSQVLNIHNFKEVEQLNSPTLDSKSVQNIARVVCPSSYISQRLEGTPVSNRTEVIPHGVRKLSSESAVRNDVIVFAGRFVIEKGLMNLLTAWSKIYETLSPYELHLYGDGPLRSIIQSRIHEMNLSARTITLGEVSNNQIREAFTAAKILVQPSLIPEAFGLSVLEGMNAGLACVVTNTGALSELIRDGMDGVVIDANHSEDIETAIIKLATDVKLRERLGDSAKQRASNSYSLERTMGHYEALFESML